MVISNRLPLATAIVACSFFAEFSHACSGCVTAVENHLSVSEGIASEIGALVKTATSVQTTFQNTSNSIRQASDDIVGALEANAAAISFEIQKSRKLETELLEALRGRLEDLAQSKLIAENNLHVAQTHGAANIPAALCRMSGNIDARVAAEAVAEAIVGKFVEDSNKRRKNYLPGPEAMTGALDLMAPLGVSEYSEVESRTALAQVPYITGEAAFDFSVDNLSEQLTAEAGSDDAAARQLLSNWMRSSNASIVLAKDIARRTRPDQEGDSKTMSMMGELRAEVIAGMAPGAAMEESQSSEAKLLRTLVSKEALSLRMKFEDLEGRLAENRLLASQVGILTQGVANELKMAKEHSQPSSGGRL